MNTRLIVLLCAGLLSAQVHAEEAIVIDVQSVTGAAEPAEAQSTPETETAGRTPAVRRPLDPSDGYQPDRERIKKGRMSARQQFAIQKAEMAEENLKAGEDFLAENKTRPGVVALASGVQYKIIKAGTGQRPTEANLVQCRYRGTLIDGTEFENRSDPRSYSDIYVSAMLPGLKEAVMLMPAGSKWQIFVPSQLAFREFGNRGLVKANATVIYEFDLMTIKR